MKKIILCLAALSLLSGCYSYRGTLSQHMITTAKIAEPTKEGKACKRQFLIFASTHTDFSVETARKSVGITEISSVEQRLSGFFPFYFERCVVVLGN